MIKWDISAAFLAKSFAHRFNFFQSMTKTIIKYVLIVCAVLYLGQIEIKDRSLGSYFVTGTKGLMTWTFTELAQHPWVAKVANAKSLSKWFPFGEAQKKNSFLNEARITTSTSLEEDSVSEEELNDNEVDETAIENESQLEDSTMMSIME